MTDTTEPTPEGNAGAQTVDTLPQWAQKVIRDLRSEAAQHRQSATESQTELDTLRTELAGIHTRAALDGLKGTMADPDDLARYVDTAALVDDAGRPDPAKYAAAADTLVAERPHLGIPKRPAGRSGNEVGGDKPRHDWYATVDPAAQTAAGTADFIAMVQGGA